MIREQYWYSISIYRTTAGTTVWFRSEYNHGEHFSIIPYLYTLAKYTAKHIISIIAHTIVSSFLA